jgi:hypothetical protein
MLTNVKCIILFNTGGGSREGSQRCAADYRKTQDLRCCPCVV